MYCNSTHLRFAPLQWPGSREELAGPSSIGHRRLPAGGLLRDRQARKDSVSYRGMRCHKTPPVNGPFRGRGSEIYCVYNSYPRQRQFGYRLSRNGSRLQTLKSSIKLVLIFKWFYALSRDGGTGRRSGLKIRRTSVLCGSTPPPGTTPILLCNQSVMLCHARVFSA